jgi:hypothetical protein
MQPLTNVSVAVVFSYPRGLEIVHAAKQDQYYIAFKKSQKEIVEYKDYSSK